MKNTNESRRHFFKIGASMLLIASSKGESDVRFKRKSPSSDNLVEVGLILGTGGHSDGIWGRFLNPQEGQIRRTGMVFTKVWSSKREVAEKFSRSFGTEVVDKFDSMVGKVDGVIVDDFNAVAYNYKLARPYLDAGIPTFVNRPFADSMQKAHDMIERSKISGAPLMTASSWEHLSEVHSVQGKVKLNEITSYEAWNSCSDFYSHGLHGLWFTYAAAGGGIEAVAHKSTGWKKR